MVEEAAAGAAVDGEVVAGAALVGAVAGAALDGAGAGAALEVAGAGAVEAGALVTGEL